MFRVFWPETKVTVLKFNKVIWKGLLCRKKRKEKVYKRLPDYYSIIFEDARRDYKFYSC